MKGLMLTAMGSGSGKTVVTCGLLCAWKERGLDIRAFKCGPDYIDPMFHTQVLGVPSRNLDLFLQGPEGAAHTLTSSGGALAVIEAAMGFYDGVAGTHQASPWQVCDAVGAKAILILRPGGSFLTLAAQVQGMLSFRRPSQIAGVLFNDCRPALCDRLAPVLERETGLPMLGCLPPMEEASVASRHLGLLTAGEIDRCRERFQAVGRQLEETADLDRLLSLAGDLTPSTGAAAAKLSPRCTIAVARDEAFCFYYADNLEALEQAGAELCCFSPIRDREIPRGADGLYLGGGYPELYAGALSQNEAMRRSVSQWLGAGRPTVAECGGFLYLQRTLQDQEGRIWPMAGVLQGEGYRTDRLQRFGYLTLEAEEDSLLFRAGEQIPAHEFHRWDCTENGAGLRAVKPDGRQTWRCGFVGPGLYAAFPHLHFGGRLPMAQRFVSAASAWREEHR